MAAEQTNGEFRECSGTAGLSEAPWYVNSVELKLEAGEVHAEPPRSECGNHGVRVVKMPWAEPSRRFTALFELPAIEFLKASVVRSRRPQQRSLDGFWQILTPEQISGIEAVAMDMWDPYIASVPAHVPEADGKIVFDKFHVAQHLGGAVEPLLSSAIRYDLLLSNRSPLSSSSSS